MGKKRGSAHLAHKASKHAPPSKKQKRAQQSGGGGGAASFKSTAKATPASLTPAKIPKTQPQHLKPTIPFSPEENILLVGEGDLSFAASLVEHHGCERVTATVLEKSPVELAEKYPQAARNAAKVEAVEGCKVLYGVDARKMGPFVRKHGKRRKSLEEEEPYETRGKQQDGDEDHEEDDAGPSGLMDRILFNFPHVGGKSTDVNRQVRYNQELVVDFFRRALKSLAPGGSIVVTLFEAEPYTLWNIRDLGRHVGLQVERSFRFQSLAYPGYEHARTLGAVRNKMGELGGGWKGNERAARSYVFVEKDDVPKPVPKSKKRRRKAEDEDDDDESGDED